MRPSWYWEIEIAWADLVLRREQGWTFSKPDAIAECRNALRRFGGASGDVMSFEKQLTLGDCVRVNEDTDITKGEMSDVVSVRWKVRELEGQ